MKRITYAFLACTAMVGLSLSACSSNDTIEEVSTVTESESATSTSDQVTVLQVEGLSDTKSFTITAGVSSMDSDSLNAAMQATDTLTVEELAYLLDLREARKLQQDLMLAAQATYTESEFMPKMHAAHKSHKDAVARMLEYYGIEVSELGEAGVFEDETLQSTYDATVAAMTSEEETLQVLMGLKETLIVTYTVDIETATNDNIKMLLENMLRAAQDHLCALHMHLLDYDVTYVPTVLTQEEFDAIIEVGVQRGPAHHGKSMYGKTNGEKGGLMNRMGAKGQGDADGEATDGKKGRQGKRQGDADGEATDSETGDRTQGSGEKGGRGGHGAQGMDSPDGGDAGDASTEDTTEE